MTVDTMHTGRRGPMSALEWVRWGVFLRREAQLEEMAVLRAKGRS